MSFAIVKSSLRGTIGCLFVIVFYLPANAHQVTAQYLDRLAAQHQACLDSGVRMLDCATEYYMTMDSLLNVVYKEIRGGLTPAQKESLKKEQLAWLRRRDALAAQAKRENARDGLAGSDAYMVIYDRQARFVDERIRELLKR